MKLKIVVTWVILVFAGGALLVACGKKTALVPPQAIIPVPISDLAYLLDENGVTLSWLPPILSEQGERLPAIDKFLVERAVYDLSDFCENCPVRYTELVSIAGDQPDVARSQQKITYREESLRPGHIYFYRVKTELGWRVGSRPSEPVSFRWQVVVGAPVELRSLAGDQQVSLSWQPPLGDLNGAPLEDELHYQVYRSVAGGNFMPLGSPVTAPDYLDQSVKNGSSYRYKVRAARLSGGTGVFSDMVTVVPRDLTPPPAPQGLSVISTPEGSRVFWEAPAVADLGGYLILRRAGDSESDHDFKVIGRVDASLTSFID
ncbi:MAG: fibronectin type III domain-containing protein, partial [Desulfobulbaceae bacterium]|nr:fibronectin type III domain-containing protein [Desulfobulbaceae bacterium]